MASNVSNWRNRSFSDKLFPGHGDVVIILFGDGDNLANPLNNISFDDILGEIIPDGLSELTGDGLKFVVGNDFTGLWTVVKNAVDEVGTLLLILLLPPPDNLDTLVLWEKLSNPDEGDVDTFGTNDWTASRPDVVVLYANGSLPNGTDDDCRLVPIGAGGVKGRPPSLVTVGEGVVPSLDDGDVGIDPPQEVGVDDGDGDEIDGEDGTELWLWLWLTWPDCDDDDDDFNPVVEFKFNNTLPWLDDGCDPWLVDTVTIWLILLLSIVVVVVLPGVIKSVEDESLTTLALSFTVGTITVPSILVVPTSSTTPGSWSLIPCLGQAAAADGSVVGEEEGVTDIPLIQGMNSFNPSATFRLGQTCF